MPPIQLTRPLRTVAAGLLAVALTATGCSSSGGGSADSTLVAYTGQAGDYQINFNPFSSSTMEGGGTIFESLFYFNITKDVPPTPLLGTEYSWNDNGTELSVTLRKGVKFSDGTPFTAKDVVFTLDLISKNKAINTTGYNGTAVAVDDTHVKITFPEPAYAQAPQVLGKTFIVPEHLWSKIRNPANNTIPKPVGTGPYVLEEFKPQAFTLKSNPAYWGGEPAVKQVRYIALAGNQSGADALSSKQIDWQTGPVPDIQNVEKNYPGYKAVTVPMNQMALFTCSNPDLGCTGPQTDPAVRQAIYRAIDRNQLNALAFQNTASDISPGFALVERDADDVSNQLRDRVAPNDPDTAAADKILRDAGYTKNSDGLYAKNGQPLELTVHVPTGWSDYITATDTMSEQLRKVGIKLVPQQVSYNEWADARTRGRFQLLIDALIQGPAADPFYVYNYFFATETTAPVGQAAYPNYARYTDPEVDAALNALKRLEPTDTAARRPHLDLIQTRIEQAMPYIPLLTGGTTSEYHAEKFTGWPTKDNMYSYPAVWSKPDQAQIYKQLKPVGE